MSEVRPQAEAETQTRETKEPAPGKASWKRGSKFSQNTRPRNGRWEQTHGLGGNIQPKMQSSLFLRWQLPGTLGSTDPTSFILEMWIWGIMVAELEDLESTELPFC